MAIKINEGKYMNGMPTLQYKIDINCVVISLSKDDFVELEKAFAEKLKTDYEDAKAIYDKWSEGVDTLRNARAHLIKLFYDGDPSDIDALFLKREPNEISEEKLNEFLDKYREFLGFV